MGHHFAAISGIQQFVIDQIVTVDFPAVAAATGKRAAVNARRQSHVSLGTGRSVSR
jgi:hypothetical protein